MSLYFMIISFVLGSVFGSFYNVCIYRIPENLSVCNPPSHCYNCNTRLKPIDLVPILSWLFIGGKCRYCKNSISPRYALIEFLTGVLFTLVYLKFGYRVITVYYMVFISLLIIISFIDIDHYIIPDKLILIGVIVSLAANGLGFGIDFFYGLRGALFTGGSMFIVIWIIEFFIKREVMGGGD
ncbi:MAG: prepilin peptidase, partial [Paeniclostridium sordellii]|nr:prepilin peptidase [Paeniclostridium sordellii]